MIAHQLGQAVVDSMTRVGLADATCEPPSPIGNFDFHGCLCGIASYRGVTLVYMTPREGSRYSWEPPSAARALPNDQGW